MSPPPVDLDHIRVRYATFRAHAAPERERLARELHASVAVEHVLLETCHRVELATVEEGAVADAQLRGEPAIRRIFEVVAGFDSAVVAEEQLLGQVRGAYESALAAGTTGPILNELFRRALRFGRSVRSHARPGSDRSLADVGADWLAAHIADAATTVLVIGTGEMGRRVAVRLAARGHRIVVSSSSGERGGALVEALPGDRHRLRVGAITGRELDEVAAVAIAVRTRSPILSATELADARPWVLDLSMPSAVDEAAAKLLGDRLLTIDALGMQTDSAPILAPSVERRLRRAMETEVEAFITWLGSRAAADALEVLHAEADAVRRRHLERLRSGGSLDEDQFAAVEAAASAMVGELLHGPSLELRRGGADADTIRRLFGLEA
ncbi:MAG: NAD(P)-binding domain-containing protein [Candidatus Limnocylindria bacterium]